jgi:hypothetical protein
MIAARDRCSSMLLIHTPSMKPQLKLPDFLPTLYTAHEFKKRQPQARHPTEMWPEGVDRTHGVLRALHWRHRMLENDATPI